MVTYYIRQLLTKLYKCFPEVKHTGLEKQKIKNKHIMHNLKQYTSKFMNLW